MEHEKSCGAVVFTKSGGALRYVLIQQKKGVWGFPKGHVEAGETEKETALREIYEETQLRPRILEGFRMTEEYPVLKKENTDKLVVYFCAEYSDQEIVPEPKELLAAALVSYEEAQVLLTSESRKRILQEADAFLRSR